MKKSTAIHGILISIFLGLGQTGCNQAAVETANRESNAQTGGEVVVAIAELQPTEGNQANGIVTFTKVADGIRVDVDITGLGENSEHGFHIHEKGDCSAPDATSAGGHFNPHQMPHGAPHDTERHVGDLGNLTADENGSAEKEFVDKHLTFDGPTSIIGRAVVVHADPDDLKSQPTGAAGARIACGVIQVAELKP